MFDDNRHNLDIVSIAVFVILHASSSFSQNCKKLDDIVKKQKIYNNEIANKLDNETEKLNNQKKSIIFEIIEYMYFLLFYHLEYLMNNFDSLLMILDMFHYFGMLLSTFDFYCY